MEESPLFDDRFEKRTSHFLKASFYNTFLFHQNIIPVLVIQQMKIISIATACSHQSTGLYSLLQQQI